MRQLAELGVGFLVYLVLTELTAMMGRVLDLYAKVSAWLSPWASLPPCGAGQPTHA